MPHTLSFSDDEFRTLALGVYLGERMANIGSTPGKEPNPDLTALMHKIYSRIDEDAGHERAEKIIAVYDEDTMFEELARSLAERDVHERLDHGTPPSDAELATRPSLERRRVRHYRREFDEHDLGHVVIDRSRPIPCETEE